MGVLALHAQGLEERAAELRVRLQAAEAAEAAPAAAPAAPAAAQTAQPLSEAGRPTAGAPSAPAGTGGSMLEGMAGSARGLVDQLAGGAGGSGGDAAGGTLGSGEPKTVVEQLADAVDAGSSGGAAIDEARDASELAAELWEATEAAAEAQLPQNPSIPSPADPAAAAGALQDPAALGQEESPPAERSGGGAAAPSQTLDGPEVEAVAEPDALLEAAESVTELAGGDTQTLDPAAAGPPIAPLGAYDRPGAGIRHVAGPAQSSPAADSSGPEAVAEPDALLEAAKSLQELSDEDEARDPAKAAAEPDALLDAAEGLINVQGQERALDPAAGGVTTVWEGAVVEGAGGAEEEKRSAAARRLRLVAGAAGLPHPDKMDRGGEVCVQIARRPPPTLNMHASTSERMRSIIACIQDDRMLCVGAQEAARTLWLMKGCTEPEV